MQGKKYVTTDQWFDGFRTVPVGEEVTLPDHVAPRLVEGGYVKPVETVTDGTEATDEKPAAEKPAAAPQNRVVSTQGTAGPPKGKK